ncbi:hypothetical protein JOF39_003533 [Glutamicibacter protophormiae]|uniref:Uncharacterized protein n=1 Tax=Glutamicibacter protophormiae TaxID=37930 RepID=A0ABS4XW12_GLUPR|nr:hypothetical protein [Glutamicibacter protophormiae]
MQGPSGPAVQCEPFILIPHPVADLRDFVNNRDNHLRSKFGEPEREAEMWRHRPKCNSAAAQVSPLCRMTGMTSSPRTSGTKPREFSLNWLKSSCSRRRRTGCFQTCPPCYACAARHARRSLLPRPKPSSLIPRSSFRAYSKRRTLLFSGLKPTEERTNLGISSVSIQFAKIFVTVRHTSGEFRRAGRVAPIAGAFWQRQNVRWI